jgi:CsoR family transcriptional regulator, copper-sensing transcriptional repressor
MQKGTCHRDQLTALKRVEGQVRGIQKMIEDQRYCVEILNAISAIRGALRKIETHVLKDHLNACAKNAFEGKSKQDKEKKLEEIVNLLETLRK